MFEVSATLHASAIAAWNLLIDTHAWPEWGPSVRAVDSPTRLIGPATRGRIRTALGVWLPFQITDWEPDRFWAWSVAGIPATGHRVTPVSNPTCTVTFTTPVWAPFYVPVCRAALRRLDRLAAGKAS